MYDFARAPTREGFAKFQPFEGHSLDHRWTIRQEKCRVILADPDHLIWADKKDSIRVYALDLSAGKFLLRSVEVADFEIDFEHFEIIIFAHSQTISQDTINHLVVDQLWPRIIGHGGELVLHAAGVLTQEGVILLIGPSGVGKSTLGASLHRHGGHLLGDDAIIVSSADGQPVCKAVYASLRLFPDSIEMVFDGPVTQSTVSDFTTKQNVDIAGNINDVASWHPLRAIFFLDPSAEQTSAEATRCGPSKSCMLLIEQSFSLNPFQTDLAIEKVKAASLVAGSVPTYRMSYPRDFSKLPELRAAMLAVLD